MNVNLLKLLEVVEWAGRADYNGHRNAGCCPVCRGIQPDGFYAEGFTRESRGHRSRCLLAALMAQLRGEDPPQLPCAHPFHRTVIRQSIGPEARIECAECEEVVAAEREGDR